jgi:hypothetical protein
VPGAVRGDVWCLLSGAREMREANPGKYQQYCIMAGDPLELNVISRDIGRTFPHHPYFQTQVGYVVKSSSPPRFLLLLFACFLLLFYGLLTQ